MEILESDKIYEFEKQKINDILFAREDETAIKNSVKELIEYLYRVYDITVILFLDEYDVSLQSAYVEGYYDEAVKFFKDFYGKTIKDNKYLEKTIITGVSRIANESIFSGANNFAVYTVLDNEFSEDFGITAEEIKKVISDFNLETEEIDIKTWYDGYTIGNTKEIYNPWSLLQYLQRKQLMPYWVNTS